MRSTQRTNMKTTTPNTTIVKAKSRNRPAASKKSLVVATSPMMLKIKAPMKVESARCEMSSATTRSNDLGDAVLLADEYAATIDATAKVAITSMLEAMMESRVSIESVEIRGTTCSRPVSSATLAARAAPTESSPTAIGLTHSRSRIRLMTYLTRSVAPAMPMALTLVLLILGALAYRNRHAQPAPA